TMTSAKKRRKTPSSHVQDDEPEPDTSENVEETVEGQESRTITAPETIIIIPDASEAIKALETYVDSRVGAEWGQVDVDTCLSYTTTIRNAGKDPASIEAFVKQRAFSSWVQNMADQVHAMAKEL